MSLKENFATFKDTKTGQYVFVDTFDNLEFNVRLGSLEESVPLGSVTADSDETLNRKLHELVAGKTVSHDLS